MNAFLIIQSNEVTGETNLTFVTEEVSNVEDYTVHTGSWKESPVLIVPVSIKTFPNEKVELDKFLTNKAFRSDGYIDSEEALLYKCAGHSI